MRQKKVIIVLVLLALLVIAVFATGSIPLGEMVVNPQTQNYNWPTSGEDCPVKGNWNPVQELCTRTFTVTAWHPPGQDPNGDPTSIPMTYTGRMTWPACDGGALSTPYKPWKYYYRVKMQTTENGPWTTLMDYNYYNSEIVHVVTSPGEWTATNGMIHWASSMIEDTVYDEVKNVYDDTGTLIGTTNEWYDVAGWTQSFQCDNKQFLAEPMEIELKGPHVGKLKVEFVAFVGTDNWPNARYLTAHVFQSDEIEMKPGTGSVTVHASGEWDGYYIFQEGDTVYFDVQTGYSGKTNGDPSSTWWNLKLYDNFGDLVTDQGFPMLLNDDWNGQKSYVLSDIARNPEGDNAWKVVLNNGLFNQEEQDFYITIFELMPSITNITYSETSYQPGESIIATCTAFGNINGTGEVYEFRVRAKYVGTTSYLFDNYIPANAIGNGKFQGVATFSAALSNVIVETRAWAFDAPHNSGGLAGPAGTKNVYIADPSAPGTHCITVYVKDKNGVFITFAKVEGASRTEYTSEGGQAILTQIPDGTYTICASKLGYKQACKSVVIAGADSEPMILVLEEETGMEILAIIIALLVILIFVVLALIIKQIPIPIRILIVVIGAIIAVAIWLVLSGFLGNILG